MKRIFLSDLHLSVQTPQYNQLLADLFTKFANDEELKEVYLLGDFFDYWLGDDDTNDFIEYIRELLTKLSQSKKVYFCCGNHDFAVGKKFAKSCNMNLLPTLSTIQVGGKQVLITHGDLFCSLDLKYQKMRKIMTNKFILFVLRRIPLSYRYKIKEKLENQGDNQENQQPLEIYHVVDKTVQEYAKKYNASIVIHGHTHNPNVYTIKASDDYPQEITRYEIPDWREHRAGGYIVVYDNDIQIIKGDDEYK